jgi:hypothetical protein
MQFRVQGEQIKKWWKKEKNEYKEKKKRLKKYMYENREKNMWVYKNKIKWTARFSKVH